MAVTKTPSPEVKSIATAGQVLCLTGMKRTVVENVLFVSDQPYLFEDPERAAKFLAMQSEGVNMFSVYKEPAKAKAEPDAPLKAPKAPKAAAPAPTAKAAPEKAIEVPAVTKIELTTPEEEAELGLPPIEDAVTI